ncbi:hypothetical protein MKX03_019938 [Papaver bracteatum]|nr:hypothetical protein MKX03_019938 [Papaver bracteatum]
MDQDCLGATPEEQRSDKLFGLEDATPKGENRRGHGGDTDANTGNMDQDHVEVKPGSWIRIMS